MLAYWPHPYCLYNFLIIDNDTSRIAYIHGSLCQDKVTYIVKENIIDLTYLIHFIHRLTVQSSVVSSQILNGPQGKQIEITLEFEIREVCENAVLINKCAIL